VGTDISGAAFDGGGRQGQSEVSRFVGSKIPYRGSGGLDWFVLTLDSNWNPRCTRIRFAFAQRFRLLKPSAFVRPSLSRPTMPVHSLVVPVVPDNDQLIFGPIDLDDPPSFPMPWDAYPDNHIEPDIKPAPYLLSYEFGPPSAFFNDQGQMYNPNELDELNTWIHDPSDVPQSPLSYHEFSPTSYEDNHTMRPRVRSVVSPAELSLQTPSWASQLWDNPTANSSTSPPMSSVLKSPSSLIRPSIRHSPLTTTDLTIRQHRIPARRSSLSSVQIFHSSSAPADPSPVAMSRSYTSRANSVSLGGEDRDATVRNTRRKRSPETDPASPSGGGSTPSKKEDPRKSSLPKKEQTTLPTMIISSEITVTAS